MAEKETPKYSGTWHGAVFVNGMSEGIMAKEKFIKQIEGSSGGASDGNHDGRHANLKREQEAQQALNDVFFDLYGIPFGMAITAGGMDNALGEHWRNVIEQFKNLISKPVDEGDIDIV